VGEIDRQLRNGNPVRNVVRRHGPNGSVSHEAGAGILSRAAVGESILGYTGVVAGRNGIRQGSRTFNPGNDSAPLTHTHTRLVNVAVVDRKNTNVFDDDKFEVQEATIVPKKSGLSILMFDLCCAKGRLREKPKKEADHSTKKHLCSSGPEYIDPAQWDRRPTVKGWDPERDYHLTREAEVLSLNNPQHRSTRSDEPLRLGRTNSPKHTRGEGFAEDPLIDEMREREAQQASMRDGGWQERGAARWAGGVLCCSCACFACMLAVRACIACAHVLCQRGARSRGLSECKGVRLACSRVACPSTRYSL
jgi:hypothetical protein